MLIAGETQTPTDQVIEFRVPIPEPLFWAIWSLAQNAGRDAEWEMRLALEARLRHAGCRPPRAKGVG